MDLFASWYQNSDSLMLLIAVIVLHQLMPGQISQYLSQGLVFFASALAKKVAKGNNKQQTLSGALALFVYLATLTTILLTVIFGFPDDALTQAPLLFLALGYQDSHQQAGHIKDLLSRQQKSTAAVLLANQTHYQTNNLSELGVIKLTNELLISRFVSYWLVPIFIFLVFNGFTALLVRCLMDAYRAWTPENSQLKHFSKATQALKQLIELPVTVMVAPVFSVFQLSSGWFSTYRQNKAIWQSSHLSLVSLVWFSLVAKGGNTPMGGPVMVNDNKFRRPRINQQAAATIDSISLVQKWIRRFQIFTIFVSLLVIIILNVDIRL